MDTTAPATKPPLWAEAAGWIGTLLILAGFGGTALGWMPQGRAYLGMNLVGAIGVAVICAYRRTWQPLFLEVVWGTVALVALLRGG